MAREGGAGAGGEDSEAGERAELDGEQVYLFLPIPSDLPGRATPPARRHGQGGPELGVKVLESTRTAAKRGEKEAAQGGRGDWWRPALQRDGVEDGVEEGMDGEAVGFFIF